MMTHNFGEYPLYGYRVSVARIELQCVHLRGLRVC